MNVALQPNIRTNARRLAQMRLATSKAALPTMFADLMADSPLSPTMADAAAAGLATAYEIARPFMLSGRLNDGNLPQIYATALAQAKGDTPEAMSEAVRKLACDAMSATMAAAEPPGRTASTVFGGDPQASVADRMADGLLARMKVGHVPTTGREFAHMSLQDMAAYHGGAVARGGNRYLMRGAHGTEDFAHALGIASNRLLLDSYEASVSTLKAASRQVPADDFRPINVIRVSTGMELGKVQENGEFTYGTIADAGEAFAVETFGKVFALTRQAMVNDDLNVFGNTTRMMGTGAALTEARLFGALLQRNDGAGPKMSDGKTLFHVDHGNLAKVAAPLDVTSLTEARVAMRRQRGLAGEAIQVQPYFLIVPPELETQAEQLVATITAASVGAVNPFADKLHVLVDANLTSASRWYLSARPGAPDGLMHAYLDGNVGPQIFVREGFETDATEFKVRLDFGCGFVDHRAWFMNPGFTSETDTAASTAFARK